MDNNLHHDADHLTQITIPRALNALSWPIALTNTLLTSHQLVNTFWVGRLGAGAVAALSISFPVLYLLISLGGGLSVAGSILVAQYSGARNTPMVNHASAQAMLMVVIVSVILSVVGSIAVRPILHLMGIGPDILEESARYMKVCLLAIVFIFAFDMFQSILRGVGEVRVPMRVIALSVGLNLALDPLFIFGWGPIPAGGVVGAAYATLVTYGLAAAVGFWVLHGNRYGVQLRLTDLVPDFPSIKRLFSLGLPASIELSMDAFGITVMTAMVSSFGTAAIAAYGIGSRVLIIILIPALSLSMAASTLVGQTLGAGNLARAKETATVSAWYSFWLLNGAGVIIFVAAEKLVGVFVPHDSAVIHEGATVVRSMAVSFGFMGTQFTLMGVLRAAGDTFVPMVLTIITVWIIQIPTAYILSHYTTLAQNGLWYSFPISAVLATALAIVRFKAHRWKRLVGSAREELQQRATDEIIIEKGKV